MASLRDLKKRLNGVRTAGHLAGAMKTVSTAKYARVNSVANGYARYAQACERLVAGYRPADTELPKKTGKKVYVLFSGNRGLCGSYNNELFAYFSEVVSKDGAAYGFVSCGKMASEHLKDIGVTPLADFGVSDVPAYDEARALSEYLSSLAGSGEVSEIILVYQKFVNMMKHFPSTKRFDPFTDAAVPVSDDKLFIPDHETVRASLKSFCPNAAMYSFLLGIALGAQSATLLAMRSAYDNALVSSSKLETAINRRRQGDVTAGVIETSSEFFN